jgi:hypothetical protein
MKTGLVSIYYHCNHNFRKFQTLGHATLMARVGTSAPRAGTGRLPIDKHNALLLLDKGVKVTKGGHYSAVITVLADGDSVYFLVTKATAE